MESPQLIKAIETRYNGYRFRSRLEARWAVFFDTAGIPYEYEREGYDLGGVRYLPDFWLPVHQLYVEIKPWDIGDFDTACQKIALLVTKTPFHWAVLLRGNPWLDAYDGMLFGRKEGKTTSTVGGVWMVGGVKGEHVPTLGSRSWEGFDDMISHPALLAAYEAARSARFEHGENGR